MGNARSMSIILQNGHVGRALVEQWEQVTIWQKADKVDAEARKDSKNQRHLTA